MAKINSLDDVFKALQEMFPDLEIETYEVKLNGTKDPDIKEIRIGDKKKEPESFEDMLNAFMKSSESKFKDMSLREAKRKR